MKRGDLVQYTGPRIDIRIPDIFSVTIESGVFGHVMETDPLNGARTYVAIHPVAYPFLTTDLRPA